MKPKHIRLISSKHPNFDDLSASGFKSVRTGYTGDLQAETLRRAIEREGNPKSEAPHVALVYEGGDMDENGIVWPTPAEDRFILGMVEWETLEAGEIYHQISPIPSAVPDASIAGLDNGLYALSNSLGGMVARLSAKMETIEAFRKILRMGNPLELVEVLRSPSSERDNRMSEEILIGLGLLGRVDHLVVLELEGLSVVNFVSGLGAAPSLEAFLTEIQDDIVDGVMGVGAGPDADAEDAEDEA
jgi:hypothetical protein